MNKKLNLFLLIITTFLAFQFAVLAEDIDTKKEKLKSENTIEETSKGNLVFKAKKSTLWNQTSKLAEGKKPDDAVEVTLPGRLYDEPTKVLSVDKKNSNLDTLEGLAASIFSATKEGNRKWIVDNFTDEDKKKMEELFKNKQFLKDAQEDAQKVKTKYITGEAKLKDCTILFVQQQYTKGKKTTEALVCKKTPSGWKITNELTNDEIYDVVFAALVSGEVIDKDKKLANKD